MTVIDTESTVARWDNPPGVAPRGTLILIPGRGEDPDLYERFGRRISADAYLVQVVADPTQNETEVLRQVHALLAERLTGPAAAGPLVLVGSDAGAVLAAGLVASGQVQAEGLILAGLPVRPESATGVDAATLSWDDEVIARTACSAHAGRLRTEESVRPGALAGAIPAAWFDWADLHRVPVPVLALHGEDDQISPLDDARAAYRSTPEIELVTVVGGRHDALNDQTHRSVAATVVLFLERLRLKKVEGSTALPRIVVPQALTREERGQS